MRLEQENWTAPNENLKRKDTLVFCWNILYNLNQLDNLTSVEEVEVTHFVIFTERIFAPSDVVTVGWDISWRLLS